MKAKLIGNFWLVSASALLSLAWLLPNHTPPWLTFHSDAWAASTFALMGMWVMAKGKTNSGWHVLTLAVGFCALIPWLQYAFGIITAFGNAWINSLYMLGFLCTIKMGEKWETESPGQSFDFIFSAIIIATIVSVGIQLRQWAGFEPLGFWTLRAVTQSRYYANLAQPNQLASLELLGLVACSWGFYRKKLSAASAIFVACFILIGVVLTESRTAMLNLGLLLVIAFVFRRNLPSKQYIQVMFGLFCYFGVMTVLVPMLGGDGTMPELRTPAVSERWMAWKMFTKASFEQPVWGFGWGQLAQAHFSVVLDAPFQSGLFTQSHNLLLDLILWNGYPIGLFLILILGWWVCKAATSVQNFKNIHGIFFIIILGTHAMLEFPLQYAFFLMPFGLIIGSLHITLGFQPVFKANRFTSIFLMAISITMLCITIRDYFRAETSMYGLRFQHYKIQTTIPPVPPDVIALTQFRDSISFARTRPQNNLKSEELQWMIDTVNTLPSPLLIFNLASNLAMNGQPAESQKWIIRLCKTSAEISCADMHMLWTNAAASSPEMAAVEWPSISTHSKQN